MQTIPAVTYGCRNVNNCFDRPVKANHAGNQQGRSDCTEDEEQVIYAADRNQSPSYTAAVWRAMAGQSNTWQRGVPMRWVTGDEVYGDSPELRDVIARHERLYVLAVRVHTPIWTQRPPVTQPGSQVKGRSRSKVRRAEAAPPATSVAEVVATWPERRWQPLTVAEGEKGLITYDWACQQVIESREGRLGPEAWLIARRSLNDPGEIAYYLSNARDDTPLLTLAQVASLRYTVEQCLEEAKGETGLDDYEVRYWHSWHRHITLSMMAHTWLASVRYTATEKKGARTLLGRTDSSGGAPLAGSGTPLALPLAGVAAGLVTLAAGQALSGPAQPLPPSSDRLATRLASQS